MKPTRSDGRALSLVQKAGRALSLVRKSLKNPTDLERGIFGVKPTASNIVVNSRVAMGCTPVRICVQVISEAIGQLPIQVYKRTDGGKDRDPNHPVYSLLHDNVNDWMIASEFKELLTRDALLHGNGYAVIERDGDKPSALIRLDPMKVTVDADDITGDPVYLWRNGADQQDYSFMDILHIRAPSLDGYTGDSPVTMAREAIGLAILMERHAAILFRNGARPGGVIEHPANLGEGAAERMTESWNEANSGDNSGGVAMLEEGAKFNPIGMTSVDAQFLEMRAFTNQEISRAFRVPPIFMNDYGRATWGNGEQQGTQLVTYCLMPWIKRWEGEIRLKLFSIDERKTHVAEILVDDLLRADTSARYESYSKAIAARFLNPNEARARENLPAYEGGDTYTNPNTTSSTGAAGEGKS